MKRIILICSLMILRLLSVAQQRELDSLLNLCRNYRDDDSVKLNLLLRISQDYSNIDPDKGLEKTDEAARLAEKLKNPIKLATAFNNKGINYEAKGADSLSMAYYNKALEIRKSIRDSDGIATTLHDMGIDYFNLSEYDKGLHCQQEALGIFERSGHARGIAISLNSIGVIYLSIADYPRALDNYFKALKIFEQTGDEGNMGIEFTNIGLIYNHMSDYQKSLLYHFKALDIYQRQGDKNNTQKTLGNIGNVYDDWNQPDTALFYYRESLKIAEASNFKAGIASAFSNIGAVYNKVRDYPQSLGYSEKALALYRESGNKLGIEMCLNQVGQTYLASPVKEYDKAIGCFNDVIRLAKGTGTLDMEDEGWLHLFEAFEKQKKFDKALAAYKKYIVIRDSTLNDNKRQEVSRREMQYEFDNEQAVLKADHDKKQALAVAEISRQKVVRNAVAGGACILLLAASVIFGFYKRRRDAEQQKKEAEFKARVSDTEMKALRAQMNPHFIFNSLNSIGYYISKNDLRAADSYLVKFSGLMRSILENSEQKEVSLASDLGALELYMQLEALRLDNKFTYEIDVDKDIDPENTLIPPLLLQPFVENSIWHGISKKEGKGKILIRIKKEGGMICCIVEDDGIGLQHAGTDEGSGAISNERKSLGMKITRSRIDILNRTKNARASVRLYGLGQGTRAELVLPLELSF